MNKEMTRDALHGTLERVIDQADEETLKFMIKKGEMALAKLGVAKGEKLDPEVRRNLFGAKNGIPTIFCGPL
jgi:hypothetical protein